MEVLALTDRTSCVDLYLDSRQLAEVAAANRERYAAAVVNAIRAYYRK